MNGRDRLLGRLSTACPVCWWVWNLAYVGVGSVLAHCWALRDQTPQGRSSE